MCRLPGYGCDLNTEPPKASSPNARKIIVFVKDWIYSVEVIEKDGTPVPPAGIERRLAEVVKDVREREARGERAAQVNILSADERDLWAKVRDDSGPQLWRLSKGLELTSCIPAVRSTRTASTS